MAEEIVHLVYGAPPQTQQSSEEDKSWGEMHWGVCKKKTQVQEQNYELWEEAFEAELLQHLQGGLIPLLIKMNGHH